MTLLEMAGFVCTKVNQTEVEDVEACKAFLLRRHEMIWKAEPWKDAVAMITKTIDSATDTLVASGQVLLPRSIDAVMAIRTSERALDIQSPEIYYRYDVDAFSQSGEPREFIHMQPACFVRTAGYTARLGPAAVSADDGTATISISCTDNDGEQYSLSLMAAPFPSTFFDDLTDGGTITEILSISKPVTKQDLQLRGDTGVPALVLPAASTSIVPYPRIRLLSMATTKTTLNVLAKMRLVGFSLDNDSPRIRGIENCLIAFAQADMLQRERQYGKAQAVQAEAMMLLEQVKQTETVQQAYNKRIIPDSGIGDLNDVLYNRTSLEF